MKTFNKDHIASMFVNVDNMIVALESPKPVDMINKWMYKYMESIPVATILIELVKFAIKCI
jgi:hypothetical protein